jgi:Cu(I)/Ag(I) efflux system membrane fusion protein
LAAVGLAAFVAGRISSPTPADGATTEKMDSAMEAQPQLWTCSMHPQILQPEPGDCPICGMDLIPLEAEGPDEGPRTMSMSESSRALAEIETTPVTREFPEAAITLVGRFEYDETKEKSLTARFPARIDELFVNYDGIRVKAGEHLARVYSPELLTAQRELITAYRSDPESSFAHAAREKLRLWDLLPEQIEEIIASGEARDNFVLTAPVGGLVVEKQVKEGDYVKTGQPLFRIADLSELWLFLDAYESDLPWLRYGQDVTFTVEAIPGETFHGRIVFIQPEVNRRTRTSSVRVNVDNRDGRLKPGMFARGLVHARMAEGGKVFAPEYSGKWISPMHPEIVKDHPGSCDVCGMPLVPAEELGYVDDVKEEPPLVIPASAALRTGKRAVVYVELPGRENPTYEGREVVLGPRAGDRFLVAEGLAEGERVVSHGAFKIDSALQIQAKPSMMNPAGGSPPPGHDHGDDTAGAPQSVELGPEHVRELLGPYLDLRSALADDDLEAARAAVRDLMEVTGHEGALAGHLHEMLDAEKLDGMRRPHFENLSNAMITAARANPDAVDGELLVMHCPMVYADRGADWLQRSEPLTNPYFGASMLRCGEVTDRIGSPEESHRDHQH